MVCVKGAHKLSVLENFLELAINRLKKHGQIN